jgi:hypothetical protein
MRLYFKCVSPLLRAYVQTYPGRHLPALLADMYSRKAGLFLRHFQRRLENSEELHPGHQDDLSIAILEPN